MMEKQETNQKQLSAVTEDKKSFVLLIFLCDIFPKKATGMTRGKK